VNRRGSWPKSKGALTARTSRRRLAEEAGLSLHLYRQAMRVVNIPKDEFERLVESDHPPTVEQLAIKGRRWRAGWDYAAPPEKSIPCPHCGGTGKVARVRGSRAVRCEHVEEIP
jgi:hypothetical protein